MHSRRCAVDLNSVLVAYVPVPHAGYLKLFRSYAGSTLYVLGEDLIKEHQPLVRNLPAAQPTDVIEMIKALRIFAEVRVLNPSNVTDVQKYSQIVMPDEDVSRAFAEANFTHHNVIYDGRWRLRWDWGASHADRRPEGERLVSKDELERELMRKAYEVAKRSPDWWRQIGALLVREGEVLLTAFNRHVPHEQSNYLYGDPRSHFGPGERIEVSAATHAEPALVAAAARGGIVTQGCDLYVTTFPCPPCAYLCALLGLQRLYYVDGYSLVAGAETLQANGVEIVRVEF
jgi:dCMP deaminase